MGILFSSRQRQASETGDHGDIEAEVIPPTGIIGLVDPNVRIEEAHDQGERRNPTVPDPHEEPRRIGPNLARLMGEAPGHEQGGANNEKDDDGYFHCGHSSGFNYHLFIVHEKLKG
jgi:hypothetical protein